MNQLSSEPSAHDPGVAARTPVAAQALLTGTTWLATLLLSKLPLVIARDLLGTDIPWIFPAWVALAALLITATYLWPAIKPLRGFFAIMGVILLLAFGFDPAIRQTAAWRGMFAGQPQIVALFGERALLGLETLGVISALFALGLRGQAFLAVGNLRAPVGGQISSTGTRSVTWSIFGPAMTVLLGGLFFAFLASQSAGALTKVATVAAWLPLVLLSAALNAFSEEVSYRAAPLSVLLPAVGPSHALWLTSLWFGLGHYYGGIPSGPVGLIQAGLLALLLGKAMLDTRGLGWSWIIHLVLDTVIYLFVAATML